jgi:hypothetical protein
MDGEMTMTFSPALDAPTDRAPPELTPETLLTRQRTAEELTRAGYPLAWPTLTTYASRGIGPSYEMWNRRPLYRWGVALAWAKARLSRPVADTKEARALFAAEGRVAEPRKIRPSERAYAATK